MKRIIKFSGFAIICLFALIGIAGTSIFVAMQYGLLNVRGTITERNASFGTIIDLRCDDRRSNALHSRG